jgi:hypothetical protein
MKPEGAKPVTIVPITLPVANAYIERVHRHHGKMPGGFAWWALAALVDGEVHGVALAGRPTNRNNDDGQTVEVLRVAADGTLNVPSALLGACAAMAKSGGAARIITYTLSEESGASLRGAGWTRETDGIKSWWTHAGSRTPAVERAHMGKSKVRWAKHFRTPIVLPEELRRPASKDVPAA